MPASYRTRGITNPKEEKQEETRKNAHRYAGLDPYAKEETAEERAKRLEAAAEADRAIGATVANAGVNVGYGAAEATEGASDFLRYTPQTVKAIALEKAANLLGYLADTVGLEKAADYFSKVEEYEIGRQNKIQEKIDYDLAGDIFGRDAEGEGYLDWQWGNKLSEKSQDAIGENANRVLEEISQGVGGMLPMVAISIASGGSYAGLEGADAIAKAAQATKALQSGLFFAQAAGQATESAGRRGASPKAALVYGLASGAVETGTEALGGIGFEGKTGAGIIGKVLDKISPGITNRILASTGGKLLWTFAGEAFEEGLSHIIDPYLDAGAGIADLPTLDEIKSGLLEDMAVGGTVGVLLNGLSSGIANIQNHSKGGSTYTKTMRSMQTVLDAMQANEAVKASSKSTQDRVNRMETATAKLIRNELNKMSTELKKMTVAERAGAFADAPVLATWLDENGNVRAETADALNAAISSGKASNTSETIFDAKKEAANLAQIADQVGQSVKVDTTELNPAERKNFASVLKANSELNKAYQNNRVVIYTGVDESIKAFTEPKKIGDTVYISRESLSNGDALQKYFHEDLGHLQELYRSTQAISELAQDEQLREKAITDLVKSDNQGLTEAEIRKVIDSVQRETDIDQLSASEKIAYEEYVARLIEFSGLDSKSASRIVAENPSGFGKLADAIRSFVENRKTKKLTDAERSRLQSMRRAERIIRTALDNRKSARIEGFIQSENYKKDRATYLSLDESEREKWLKDHKYTADEFAPGVLGEAEDVSTLPEQYREEYLAASREAEEAEETKKAAEAEEKSGKEKYDYDSLIAKDDLTVVELGETVPTESDGTLDREAIVNTARENIIAQNNPKNTDTAIYVRVLDIGKDVLVGAKGLRHGLTRGDFVTAKVTLKIGDILRSSIAVNELNGDTKRNTKMSYVLLGIAEDSEASYAVRFVVEQSNNSISEISIYKLSAAKGKKIENPNPALKRGAAVSEQSPVISSGSRIISISQLFSAVKREGLINEVFSKDVAEKLGVERSKGDLSDGLRFSKSSTEKDSTGRTLSVGQAEYFKDSKVRNENGDLLPVYHGTDENFTVFDVSRGRPDMDIQGMFFTPDKADAQGYGSKVKEYYLDIQNPADFNTAFDAFKRFRQEDNAGVKTREYLEKLGYDGVIVDGEEYIAFRSEQAKLVDNLSPTSNPDIRFSKESPYTSSEGAVAGEKVYSKKDAQETIEAIVSERLKFEDPYSYSVGKLSKTAFEQATSKLFKDLNNLDPGKRGAAALNLADYIVEKALVEQIYDEFSPSDEILERSADIVSLMNSVRHRLRLDRYKGDIIYTNDKKPAKGLLLQWAASEKNRASAVGLDQLVDLFDEIGVKLEGDHPADIFQNALELYEDAKVHLDEALGTVRLSKFASEEQIKNLKQQIAKDILLAYDEKGEPSKLKQRLNDAYTEIESLQKELQDERGISKLRLQVLRDLRFLRAATNRTYAEKNGIAISANLLDDPTFHDVAKAVSSVMRGDNISPKNVRERMLNLRKTFFSSDNTILQDWIDSFGQNENDMGQITADQIIQALDTLNLDAGDGTEFSNEPLSYKEWKAFSQIAKFIKKVYTDYDSYYEDGKRYVLSEKAKDYQKVLQFANDTRNGRVRVVQNLFTNYEQAFGTPRTWARMVDGYNDFGFFTHTQYRLEKDSWKQQIEEDRIDKAVDDFVKKHKGYEKRLRERIAYDGQAGTKILVAEAIDIYLQSTQANGLLTLTNEKGGGFHYTGEDGKRAPNTLHFTKESLDSLFQSFTAEDKEFMALIMAGYEEAGKLRHDTNIRLTGFSSEVKDRYYPLRREGSNIQSDPTNAAHALRDIQAMNNLSWNKQRRTNALAIPLEASNALEKFYRHIHQSTMFWAFSEDLHNIRRIYNKDFSATRSGEQTIKKMLDYAFPVDYAKGERKNKADVYFTKLLNDIQGVSTKERTAFSRGMQKLRGAYATASLGVNIKVSLAQLASIPNAYQYIDASVMLKALVTFQNPANAKQRTEQMDEFSKTALVRHLDKTVVQSEALLDKVGKISDKLTYLIQFNDRMAISFLWKCAQLQVAKDTGYAVGTEENLTTAGELLDEINTVTQPTYQATDRSAFQRSDNELIKSLAMFKSVPTKQLSMLFDAYGEATALPRQIKYLEKQLQNQSISAEEREAITNQVKDLKERQKQSGKKVARATVAVIAAQAMYTAIGFAVTKFILRKLDDDESPLKTLLISCLDSMVSILPIIGDLYDLIFHGRELEDVSLNMMNTVFTDITKTFTADDDAARARAFRNLGIDVTMMFGLPTRNARNLFLGMTKNISPSLYDSIEAPFTTPKTTGITDALKAGNLDIARNTTRRVMAAKGFEISESQAEALTDLYGSGYDLPSGPLTKYTVDGVEYTLTDAEKDNFALVYSGAGPAADELVEKASYNKLTDKGKAKAISTVYSFYRDKAKVESVGIDASKLYLFGTAVDPTQLALILAGVNDLLDKAKASGKEYDRKALITEFLKRQDLTAAQKYMLMGYFGYKNTNGADQVKSYINRLQLTKAEKQKLYEYCKY